MSEREIITGLLRRVHRRIRFNQVVREISLVLSFLLTVPIGLKVLDLAVGLDATLVAAALVAWIALLAGLIFWRLRRKTGLAHAAAVLDAKAGLQDEMKSAFWFLQSAGKSDWTDVQIARAAITAGKLRLKVLFPTTCPPAIYIVSVLLVLFAVLNLIPAQGNRNWLSFESSVSQKELLTSTSAPNDPQSNTSWTDEAEVVPDSAPTEVFEPSELQESVEAIRLDHLNEDDRRDLDLANGSSSGPPQASGMSGDSGSQSAGAVTGMSTQLNVRFQRERLTGQTTPSTDPSDFRASRKEASRLGYRYPPQTFSETDGESLDAAAIPWEYRQIVKEYFDSIRTDPPK